MKENSKNIEMIFIKSELVGFYHVKEKQDKVCRIENIYIKQEHKGKGIEEVIIKESENKHR